MTAQRSFRPRFPIAPMGASTFRVYATDGSAFSLNGATWTQARGALAQACGMRPADLARSRFIRCAAQESFRLPGGAIAAIRVQG